MSVIIRHAAAEDRAVCIDFIGTLNGGPVLDSWIGTFDALVERERGALYVAEDAELGVLGGARVSFNLSLPFVRGEFYS